jgi:hypothetical protein
LYDAWCDLYGEAFADRAVEQESSNMEYYKNA